MSKIDKFHNPNEKKQLAGAGKQLFQDNLIGHAMLFICCAEKQTLNGT